MATQVTRQARQAAADDIVLNDAGLEELRPQIARLHANYIEFSERMVRLPLERL